MFKTDAKSVNARTFFRGIHLSIDFPGALPHGLAAPGAAQDTRKMALMVLQC